MENDVRNEICRQLWIAASILERHVRLLRDAAIRLVTREDLTPPEALDGLETSTWAVIERVYTPEAFKEFHAWLQVGMAEDRVEGPGIPTIPSDCGDIP